MKSFLIKVLWGCTLSLVLVGLFHWFALSKYEPTRIPRIKKHLFNSYNEKSVNLVLGSSHTFHGINSSKLGKHWFNLASFSQSFYEDYTIIKTISISKQIDSILLPINYFANFNNLRDNPVTGERMRLFDYKGVYPVEYNLGISTIRNQLTYWSAAYKAVFTNFYMHYRFDKLGNMTDRCIQRKWAIAGGASAFKRHNQNVDFSKTNAWLDSIIGFCKSKNVRLIFVISPMTKNYEFSMEQANMTRFYEVFLNRLQAKTKDLSIWIDGRELFPQNQEIYFRDADHLSSCGRDSLTKVILSLLKGR